MQSFRPFHLPVLVVAICLLVACDKVPLTSPTGSTITLAINKTILPINGTATVTATVTESSGSAVHNGTTVTFTSNLGGFEPIETQTTNGSATVTFLAGATSGTATINAFSGAATTRGSGTGATATPGTGIEVKIGSAAAGTVSIRTEPATVPQNGGTVTVIALVQDASGNALPGVSVVFTSDQGSLASSNVLTDANGFAQTAITTNRVTKVTASVADKKGEATISVVTAPTVTFGTISPGTPVAGLPISFTLTPSPAATANPIQTLQVEFGDGTSQTFSGVTGPVGVTHVYAREGGYTIKATATDITGIQGVSSQSVVIGFVLLPTVTLSASPNPVPAASNGVTTFTIGITAGSAPIRSVVVKLSNGTVIFSGTSAGTFVYQFPSIIGGTINTVTATVTDAAGNTNSTTITIAVGS